MVWLVAIVTAGDAIDDAVARCKVMWRLGTDLSLQATRYAVTCRVSGVLSRLGALILTGSS
jgi:hypothetical protein